MRAMPLKKRSHTLPLGIGAVALVLAASGCQSISNTPQNPEVVAMAKAGKAYFEEKCKTVAGEKIYRTVADVEGAWRYGCLPKTCQRVVVGSNSVNGKCSVNPGPTQPTSPVGATICRSHLRSTYMPTTSIITFRTVALALLSLACTPVPAAPNKADGWAFATYVQSLGTQVLARTCERADAGYMVRFSARYEAWSRQNAALIARGEQLYLEALGSDSKVRDNPKVAKIEAARQTLSSSSTDNATPIVLTDQMRAACEDNLNTLGTP